LEIKKLIEMLLRLGFNRTEAKVYIALLGGDSLKASEITVRSGVPRQKVYGALKKLSHSGFCIYKPGKIHRYSATDPQISINDYIKAQKEQEVFREATALELLMKLGPMFEKSEHQFNPFEFIEIVKGKNQIERRIIQLEDEIETEFLGFIKVPYVKPPPKIPIKKISEKKLRMRCIYEIDKWNEAEFLENQIRQGIEARFVEKLPMKLAIYDSRSVMLDFQLPTDTPTYTIVVIEHPYFAQLMKIAFNSVWEESIPLIDRKELIDFNK